MATAGLDFGTSNTTIGVAGRPAGEPALVAVEDGRNTIPSAVFYDRAGVPLFGRAAIAAYVEGRPGRLMRALKSVLGNSLIEETTQVGRTRLKFRDVIARYVGEVKARAEAAAGEPLDSVVHGRPVHFVDGDPAGDLRAEAVLHAIAREVGFRDVSFQFEPIAAALDYEQSLSGEDLALIADIGGGTSDFSIVRLGPERRRAADRGADILANDGVRIGGTDFDRLLSLGVVMPLLGLGGALVRPAGLALPSGPFHDLATWSTINRLYDPAVRRRLLEIERDAADPRAVARLVRAVEDERGHAIAISVEGAKIALAETGRAEIPLAMLEDGLAAVATHDDLVRHTEDLAARIAARVRGCLAAAGLGREAIGSLFLTGGSTGLAHVRAAIVAELPGARVVEGDTFGSVGTGLTLEAARRYGR